MALTFGVYTWPAHPTAPAVAAVLVLTGANCLGIARTARSTRVLVALTLLALAAVVAATLGGCAADPASLAGWSDAGIHPTPQAAAPLFFAFAGYARIATLGEEVRDPARTIPRAIPIALAVVVAVYAVVGVAALSVLGPTGLATAAAPLAEATSAGSLTVLTPAVRIGGALASAGVLLSLLAGVGRTTLVPLAEDVQVRPIHLLDVDADDPPLAALRIAAGITTEDMGVPGMSGMTFYRLEDGRVNSISQPVPVG